MGHRYDFGPWRTYVFQRLGGLEMIPPGQVKPRRARPARPEPGAVVLSAFPERRDWVQFSEAYGDPGSGVALPNRDDRPAVPVCRSPVTYRGTEPLQHTIANFKAALAAAGLTEGFLNAVGPASCARFANEYYEDDEELLYACADAMRAEYRSASRRSITRSAGCPPSASASTNVVASTDCGPGGRVHRQIA